MKGLLKRSERGNSSLGDSESRASITQTQFTTINGPRPNYQEIEHNWVHGRGRASTSTDRLRHGDQSLEFKNPSPRFLCVHSTATLDLTLSLQSFKCQGLYMRAQ